jgi:membrane protein YdbS with pleckstrin-like domain
MAGFKFTCPHCGWRMDGDDALRGQTIRCASCSGAVIIPMRSAGQPTAKVAVIDPDPVLQAGPAVVQEPETEVFDLHPTARAFIGELCLGVLLLPVVVGLVFLFRVWYRVVALRYRLSTQRLFVYKGLVAKQVEEVELFRIKDVFVKQSLTQRILGFGTITVLSTDDNSPRIELIGINSPVEVKETIRDHFRAARQREGVRAAEFITS